MADEETKKKDYSPWYKTGYSEDLKKVTSSVEELSKASDERRASYEDKDKRDLMLGKTSQRYKDAARRYREGQKSDDKFFKTPDSEAEAVAQQVVKDVLISGQTIEEWVDFWAFVDKNLPQVMGKIENAKSVLLTAVDIIEAAVKTLKKIVDMVAGIIAMGLDMLSLAIILVKSFIQSLKAILKQLLKIFDVPLLRSGAHVAQFWLWQDIPGKGSEQTAVQNINAMAPFVSAKLNEMVTQWFNRPTAENELCMAAFLPVSFEKEAADFISKCAELPELVKKLLKRSKDRLFPASEAYRPEGTLDLITNLKELTRAYATFNDADDSIVETTKQLTEECLGIMSTQMDKPEAQITGFADTLRAEYDLYMDQFTQECKNQFNGGSDKDILPGILYKIAAASDGENETVVEANFANGQSHYVAAVMAQDGASQRLIFSDCSFPFATVLQLSSVKQSIKEQIRLFNTAVMWARQVTPEHMPGMEAFPFEIAPRIRKDKRIGAVTVRLYDALKDYFDRMFDSGVVQPLLEYYAALYPIKVISDEELFMRLLKKILARGRFKNEADATNKQADELGRAFKYWTRTVIDPASPRMPQSFTINKGFKNGSGNDGCARLTFALVSDKAKYYGPDFVGSGEPTYSASQQLRNSPGSLVENLNIKWVTVTVKDVKNKNWKITPRWYGIGTPPGVSDITASWLYNHIPAVSDMIAYPMTVLDAVEKYLDKFGETVNEYKLILQTWVNTIEEYYRLIMDFIAALRRMLLAIGLPNLPTIYVAIWQGGIKDLPGKLMSGLSKRGIANSTYGGWVLFASESGSNTLIEAYKAHQIGTSEIENIKARCEAASREYEELATSVQQTWDSGIKEIKGYWGVEEKEGTEETKEEVEDEITSETQGEDTTGSSLADMIESQVLHELGINIIDQLHLPDMPGGKVTNIEKTTVFDSSVFRLKDEDLTNEPTATNQGFGTGRTQAELVAENISMQQKIRQEMEQRRNI